MPATTAATAIEAASASHDGFARSCLVPPTEDFDPRAQSGRGGLARQAVMNKILQFLHAFGLRGKRRLLAHLLGDAEGIRGVEFAIEIGVDQQH